MQSPAMDTCSRRGLFRVAMLLVICGGLSVLILLSEGLNGSIMEHSFARMLVANFSSVRELEKHSGTTVTWSNRTRASSTSDPVSKYPATSDWMATESSTKAPESSGGTNTIMTSQKTSGSARLGQLSEDCALGDYEAVKTLQPRVRLDPDKILYPALLWGPNNQLEGLRESIYMAIKLNRTLVLPYFYPQHNDKSGPPVAKISPFNRIDVKSLARFVSVIDVHQMRERCNGTFNVAFQSRPRWCEAVQKIQVDTGMEILNATAMPEHPGRFKLSMKPGPKCWQPQISAIPNITRETRHNINRLPEIFNTTAKCAVLLFPFLSLTTSFMSGFRSPLHTDPEVLASATSDETVGDAPLALLVDAIEHATGRPPYVRRIVERFVHEVINASSFVAVHWRFDSEMMRSLCNQKSGLCEEKPSPSEVARALASVQRDLGSSQNSPAPIYIAAPPTIPDFIEEVRKILLQPAEGVTSGAQNMTSTDNVTSENNVTSSRLNLSQPNSSHLQSAEITSSAITSSSVFRFRDLSAFLERHYPPGGCPGARPTPNELVSLLEMEIAARSRAFLFSSGSTWSAMVLRTRPPKMYPLDRSTMHLIIKQRNARR